VSESGIIGQAYGRNIPGREVVAIGEAVRKLRRVRQGEQSDRFPEVRP